MSGARWLSLFALSSTLIAQSTPADRHAPIFGTYSNLIYDANETGDIGGTELTVIPQYVTAYFFSVCCGRCLSTCSCPRQGHREHCRLHHS
jgi:hypothetical protein